MGNLCSKSTNEDEGNREAYQAVEASDGSEEGEVVRQINKAERGGANSVDSVQIRELQNENNILKNQLKTLEESGRQMTKMIGEYEKEKEIDRRTIKELGEEKESLRLRNETQRKELVAISEETERKSKDFTKKMTERMAAENELKRKLQDSELRYQDCQKKLKKCKEDLTEMTSRFSKACSENVHRGNAAIEDLSTQHRPMKLAERFRADLYGSVWCDAYEALEGQGCDEETVLLQLRQMLTDIYEFCCSQRTGLLTTDMGELLFGNREKLHNETPPMVDERKRAGILEFLRKSFTTRTVISLKELYFRQTAATSEDTVTWRNIEALDTFVNLSMELCWLMVIQDPPMVLHYAVPDDGGIDSAIYNLYSAASNRAKFIVWPALLLHQDGIVMEKGIVYGETP